MMSGGTASGGRASILRFEDEDARGSSWSGIGFRGLAPVSRGAVDGGFRT